MQTKVYIGTSGWSFDDWQGAFYPKKLAKKDWLPYYAKQFNCVELNATAYRFFKPENYINWHHAVPKHFQFIVKTPRIITHRKLLIDSTDLIKTFCSLAANLEQNLALILLQLPPFMPYEPERLRKALLTFDDPTKVVVEFRDSKWLTAETKQLLTEMKTIFCAVDSPKIHLTNWLTSKTAYIRMHGHTEWYDYHYTKTELATLMRFMTKLHQQGANKIFVFFNNDYYGYAPKNALELKELINAQKITGLLTI